MTKIKESMPKMTYYANNNDMNIPKELQGVHVVVKKTAGTRKSSRRRSMSASSKNSERSFRRKMADWEASKYNPSGGKFLKPTLKGNKLPKLKNMYQIQQPQEDEEMMEDEPDEVDELPNNDSRLFHELQPVTEQSSEPYNPVPPSQGYQLF